jgi:hypothetical protein
MTKRISPILANYPAPEDFVRIARNWRPDAIYILLGIVWKGYDKLIETDKFEIRKDDSHIEDEITKALCARIQDVMHDTDPYFPYAIVHQWTEGEMAKEKGRQPQCDLAFRTFGGNVRSHFTIEAKVIHTEGAVSEYVSEIKNNLLTCRYSTYSSEAAMLGYLLSGCPQKTFGAIAMSLQCELLICVSFKNRNHRCSNHQRKILLKGDEKMDFLCHHLLMEFSNRSGADN